MTKNQIAKAVKADKKLQAASVVLHGAAIAYGEAETAEKLYTAIWRLRRAANKFTNRLRIFFKNQRKKNG